MAVDGEDGNEKNNPSMFATKSGPFLSNPAEVTPT